ncbi:MAG: TolC family protein, partial [Candidatus Binatia bacterium]
LLPGDAAAAATPAAGPLLLPEVVSSVRGQYPPLLAALIERDIAAGRLRSAEGAFDFNFFARVFGTPAGYYESGTLDTGFEQFTGLWGATIFGGYRLTRGDTLPDYDSTRTQAGGEPRLGLRVPLLRDGSIDRRRAQLLKAKLDQEAADPFIQRQQLDFTRAATVAYYGWLAAGERLRIAEKLRKVAEQRTAALEEQARSGLLAPIVLTDNRRLVVSREIAVVQARRRFEAAALALSLFLRDRDDEPVVAGRERHPGKFPAIEAPAADRVDTELAVAFERRPEIARFRVAVEKLEVDRRLARNQMLPSLDLGVTASRDVGDDRYFDKDEFELQGGIELRIPLQRREAKGRLAEIEGQIAQTSNEQRFARDRIRVEVRDAHSALVAAHRQLAQAALNVELARELQAGEDERFLRGASDLLALQIREQATYDAEVLEVDAVHDYFRAGADYRAATAVDLPADRRGN